MNLSGTWRFELDPGDRGVEERWFERPLDHRIQLPGALQAQGYGEEISVETAWIGSIVDRSWYTDDRYEPYRRPGNVKVPFWLQPERYYAGPAWYQREVEIPADWSGRRAVLTLERPHWETRVWVGDREAGRDRSLSTPHVYDLVAGPGRHTLTIRIDNRMLVDVGPNAHSLYDGTQTNWNGIVGRIDLAPRSPVFLDRIDVYPDLAGKAARVTVKIGNAHRGSGEVRLDLRVSGYDPVSAEADLGAEGASFDLFYPLGEDVQLWDEFSPALYRLDASIGTDSASVTFGMRELGVDGTRLTINGRPLFLRGTLECCIFPLTGHPPTGADAWKRIIRVCKAHGLNHIRFHSWCPPEAAFVAADELGFHYQVECGVWGTIGEGEPVDEWLYEEAARILAAYGNHPSFCLMAHGNEPGGDPEGYLPAWLTHWKQEDPRRLYTGGAGWPALAESDYHVLPEPRIQRWEEGLASRINARPPETCTDYRDEVAEFESPVVSHEIGQWCVYPNFDEIPKYTGSLKPRSFEIFRDFLEQRQLDDQARDFLAASGKLQVSCYKEEIEAALRTPGFGGFQLLDLHDFPGQGTAPVGVLDAFWDSKGYVSSEEFRRFCNTTVPLARLEKRTWHTGETFSAEIGLAHCGPAPLADAVLVWKLVDTGGGVAAHGRFGPMHVPLETGIRAGTVSVELGGLNVPRKYTLVGGIEGTEFENDWGIWLFPERLEPAVPEGVRVVDGLAGLGRGERALLRARPTNDVALGYSPIFWNTAFTQGQAPHTLGILCDPGHPLFRDFPTEFHTNWQWWELLHGAAAIVLDDLPSRLRPLVQVIDDWFQARRLGLVFEARVGRGSVVVCSLDLSSNLDERLVARQLRQSILSYMASDDFRPEVEIAPELVAAVAR